jgi:hypothetical protein
VRAAADDDAVKQAATDALRQFAGIDGAVGSAWRWCKLYIKFVHHEFIIQQRLGESGHLQGLISPEVLVRMERPEGDCAIFSECIAAFLTVFGVPYEFVTVAVNPDEPEIFSHVYVYAVLPDGSRLPLDASHGQYPGWQVPSSRVSRRQVWDSSGNPVPDRGSRFDGLHAYGLRGGRGLGSMICCDDNGNFFDDGVPDTGALPLPGAGQEPLSGPGSTPSTPGQFIDYTTGQVYTGPTYQAPSQNSAQWAAFATSLAKMGFTQAAINSIQPGTVVSANGAILRQNPGYSVPAAGSVNASLTTALGGNTVIYLAVAAVAALVLMGKK